MSVMAQAAHKIAPEPSRFEDAIGFLSHVAMREKGQGRDYWVIGDTAGITDDRTKTARVLANYSLDCDLGRVLGANFVAVLIRYPELAHDLTALVLKDMVKHGRFSGVEIAFIEALTRSVAVNVVPVAVGQTSARAE